MGCSNSNDDFLDNKYNLGEQHIYISSFKTDAEQKWFRFIMNKM
jgi:hypothetical protein